MAQDAAGIVLERMHKELGKQVRRKKQRDLFIDAGRIEVYNLRELAWQGWSSKEGGCIMYWEVGIKIGAESGQVTVHQPLYRRRVMNTRHMVMQVLAWMWCIIFSMWVGSVVAFGISAIAHALLIAGIFITAGVFETAKRRPQYFGGLGRGNGGEHEYD